MYQPYVCALLSLNAFIVACGGGDSKTENAQGGTAGTATSKGGTSHSQTSTSTSSGGTGVTTGSLETGNGGTSSSTPMASGGTVHLTTTGALTVAGSSSTTVGGTGGTTSMPSTTQPRVSNCPGPVGGEMPEATVPNGYCAWVFAENLSTPRGMVTDSIGQILLIERGASAVTMLWDENGDRINQPSERLRLVTVSGLNHGIAINGGYLYASTASTVYRWPYTGARATLSGQQTVVTGMPSGGNHVTRTIVFDSSGNLYISIGSASNIDADSSRARIIRFSASAIAAGPVNYSAATVFADGTRNEVGLRFDSQDRLWGVENGADDVSRTDLGGDIHTDNPAEELNLFATPGAFYGYPYCWSEGNLPTGIGLGAGSQWAFSSVMQDGTHTDTWCRNSTNVVPPKVTMQAHSAPLDVLFYTGGSFPADVVGDAIISFHGSWNRSPATGYKVVRVPFGVDGMPNGPVTPLLESAATGDTGGDWPHRPVSLAMGSKGEIYVTSDASGLVLAVGHNGT